MVTDFLIFFLFTRTVLRPKKIIGITACGNAYQKFISPVTVRGKASLKFFSPVTTSGNVVKNFIYRIHGLTNHFLTETTGFPRVADRFRW